MKASVGLDPKREEQMKTTTLPFVFLFNTIVYLSVDLSIIYIMEKCKEHFHHLFFFSQPNLLHFHFISKESISIFKLIYFEFRLELMGQKLKKKFIFSYRQITDTKQTSEMPRVSLTHFCVS